MAKEKNIINELTVNDKVISYFKENYSNLLLDEFDNIQLYSDLNDEYNALHRGVGIRNISLNAFIEMTGENTLSFLNRISTNNVESLEVNKTIKTLFTNPKGGVIGRTSLMNIGDNRFFLLGSFNNNVRLSHWVRNFMTDEKIKISDRTSKHLLLEIYGQQADSYLTIICGNEIDNLKQGEIMTFTSEGFVFHLIKTNDAVGNIKYWLILLNDECDKFLQLLLDSKSVFDLKFVGEKAYNIFRIENGIPIVPNEFTGNYNPVEAGIENEVDLSKPTFIGKDVIVRKEKFDIPKKLFGLNLNNLSIEQLPFTVFDAKNKAVAIITSIAESIKFNKQIGLGYFSEEDSKEKKNYFDASNNPIDIELVELPFK